MLYIKLLTFVLLFAILIYQVRTVLIDARTLKIGSKLGKGEGDTVCR